jgi:RNA polymerase sigma-70 factor (sigma-E family)
VRGGRDNEYAGFVRAERPALLRWATSLTIGNTHTAEDLVQTALIRVYLHWGKARRGNPAAYARRVLLNVFLDHRRRARTRYETTVDAFPDLPAPVPADAHTGLLRAALAGLPPRMRAAVVLRHVEGLTVEETAHVLGCSPGTVKSQTARGLEKLRTHLNPNPIPSVPVAVTTQKAHP